MTELELHYHYLKYLKIYLDISAIPESHLWPKGLDLIDRANIPSGSVFDFKYTYTSG
jgi:hypothetical protein